MSGAETGGGNTGASPQTPVKPNGKEMSEDESLWDTALDIHVRENWVVDDYVEVYSNNRRQWFQGQIIDIFEDEDGEWLELLVGENMVKQVQRFSEDIRVTSEQKQKILKSGNDDEQKDGEFILEFAEPGRELGPITENEPESRVADAHLLENQEIVVIVERAGTAKCNGKYKQAGLFNQARKFEMVGSDMVISRKYQDTWILHDTENEYYEISATDDVPPNYGWDYTGGSLPVPGFRHHFIKKKKEEFVVEECADEEEQFPFEMVELQIVQRPLGIVFVPTGNAAATFSVEEVQEGGSGFRAGIQVGDVLVAVNDEEVTDNDDLRQILTETALPFIMTIRRQKTQMPVLECNRGAIPELNGKYTIAGEFQNSWRFQKNDDPDAVIIKIHEEEDDVVWCMRRNGEDYYVGLEEEEEPGLPPCHAWDIATAKSKYPVPGVKIHWVTIDPPPQPKITKVKPGDGSVELHFTFEGSLVHRTSKQMMRWFQMESFPVTHVVKCDEKKRMIRMEGLSNGQEYVFFIKACNQILSTRSAHSEETTPLKKPGKPKIVKLDVGDGRLAVHIDKESFENAEDFETQATLFVRILGEGINIRDEATKSVMEFEKIKNGVDVEITVEAENASDCTPSDVIKTYCCKPPPAPKIQRTLAGNRALRVEWECPGYDKPDVRASFEIETIPPTTTVKSTEMNAALPRCINGQPYKIVVKSVNPNTAASSKPSKPLIPLGPPITPTIVQLTPRDSAVQIEWKCEDLATPEEAIIHFEYNTTLAKEGRRGWINIGKKSPYTVKRLTNGDEVSIFLRAVNKRGASKPSEEHKCIPIAPPPKPIKVEAIPGNEVANVFWVCADVASKKFDGWFIVESDQSQRKYQCKRLRCRVRGLQNGVPYRFTVTAKNLAGEARSDPSPAITCNRHVRKSVFETNSKQLRFIKDDQNISYHKSYQQAQHRKKMDSIKHQYKQKSGLRRKFSVDAAEEGKRKREAKNARTRRAQREKEERLKRAQLERKRKAEEKRKKVMARRARMDIFEDGKRGGKRRKGAAAASSATSKRSSASGKGQGGSSTERVSRTKGARTKRESASSNAKRGSKRRGSSRADKETLPAPTGLDGLADGLATEELL